MKWIGISSFTTERRRLSSSRGFSLTELAIVLGVGGIILGGVWAYASQSWENSRQQTLKTNIGTVVRNVRSLYGGQNGISGVLAVLTLKLTGLSPSVIPGDMLRTGGTGGCTVAATAACADHPWGALTAATVQAGSFGVCAWDPSVPACAAGTTQFFAVELDAMPLASCIKAALLNSAVDGPPGLYDVVINGTSILNAAGVTHQFPVRLTDAGTLCTNNATMDFVYRVVTPQS